MIDQETRTQIENFLTELDGLLTVKTPEEIGDFRFLYNKYPLVRLCIRRAILITKQRKK